jgi:hypothetical protein
MLKKILFILVSMLSCYSSANATKYFVSATGDDTQLGTSVATAWRTISKVNSQTFQPGDHILFEAGQTFSGSIWLQGAGTATEPIIMSSYGTGPATIDSGVLSGFLSYNSAGIELRRLNFVGAGQLTNTDSGIVFYLDALNTNLNYLRLDSLDVSGYLKSGINVHSYNEASGYSDVRLNFCKSHDNGEAGITSNSQALNAHHNWYVTNCQAYNIKGRQDVTTYNTGNGIVLAGVDGALIEHCLAYNNGALNGNPSGGPAGIWGYRCNNLTIQYSESHHNDSGTQFDGGGFDLDGGCTNSVLQYNYSHDNSGPGFLLSQYYGAEAMHDVVVRYNVSDNDARHNSQGALEVWSSGASGGIVNATFYNNTVRLGAATDNSQAKAVKVMSCDYTNLSFRNNVLKTSGGVPSFSTTCTTGNIRLEGNSYWDSNQAFYIDWNGTAYHDLVAFRAATGQEQMLDGRLTGISSDPQLPSANLAQAPLYSSPLRRAGINLWKEFGVDPGTRDFAGNPLPTAPIASSVGAFEISDGPLPVVLVSFTAQRVQGEALLRWTTASEQNNAYFAVEFSLDGRVFTELAQVPGQGISTQAHVYQYLDAKLSQHPSYLVYYRLRQVDTDNTTTYSPVCTLRNDSPAITQLRVYPSPTAAATVVLIAGATDKTVQLLNVRGQLLATVPARADGTAELPTLGLAPGLYLVRTGTQSTKLLLTP